MQASGIPYQSAVDNLEVVVVPAFVAGPSVVNGR
jgi:hypothetical protein